jgi:hypothetical protein
MTNTEDLLSYLGLSESDAALISYMNSISISLADELKLEKGRFWAYIERQKQGFSLSFTDEAMFLGIKEQAIGVGGLYFSCVFFYSEGKDDYLQYQGTLPLKLSFQDTRNTLIAKLGHSSWQEIADDGERVISDRWDNLPDTPYRLHISYYKKTGKVSIFAAEIANKGL